MAESEIGCRAIRATRAAADGTPAYNSATGAFVLCGGVSTLQFDFEVEAGASIFIRDAAGNPCVNRKRPDDVKYAKFTLTLCRDDSRFGELVQGDYGRALTDAGGYVIGRGVKGTRACGSSAARTGVILEAWADLVDCDKPATPHSVRRHVFPYCWLTPKGHTLQDGASLPVYDGICQVNGNIANGPFNDFDVTDQIDDLTWFYFDEDDNDVPACAVPLDYVRVPHNAS